MGYRGIIFDLDGTLLDTLHDLADAMNSALAACGLPPRPSVDEHKYFIGDGVTNYILRAMPEGRRGHEDLIERIRSRFLAAYAAGWNNKTQRYDGVLELLSELARRGVRSAVLSNKPDDATRLSVEEFFGRERFDVVRGAREGSPLKPDPAGAIAVAERMGIHPHEFAYVGDTATDMKTAVAADMFAIGAAWGFRAEDELVSAGAQALAATPADVLKCL